MAGREERQAQGGEPLMVGQRQVTGAYGAELTSGATVFPDAAARITAATLSQCEPR